MNQNQAMQFRLHLLQSRYLSRLPQSALRFQTHMEVTFLQIQIWRIAHATLLLVLAHPIHAGSRLEENARFRIEAALSSSKTTMTLLPTPTLNILQILGNVPVNNVHSPNPNPGISRTDVADQTLTRYAIFFCPSILRNSEIC